jgi:Na+-transporting methylmalonyl-CoA/oxaloacetate decarboxylase gamma subunit
MVENLSTALGITVVGMTLVFAGILLLWGLMVLLVKITAEEPKSQPVTDEAEQERKRQAASVAAAVALAMNQQKDVPHVFPLPPTAIVSAWQAVMRAKQLKQRGPR